MDTADILVLGAGIAGASLAAEVAALCRVIVVEIEDRAGRHATGRSAATFAENYGNATVRALSRASRRFFENDREGFGAPLMKPRGALFIADASRHDRLEQLLRASEGQAGIERLDGREVLERCPILRPHWSAGGVYDAAVFDLDVAAIHQGFLRQARASNTTIVLDAGQTRLSRAGSHWHVDTQRGSFAAPVVVNATGAWADEVARSAGARPMGLQPVRRTCVMLPAPEQRSFQDWPMVVDVDERMYFKPESGQILLSPANEDPSEPCDAMPEEMDVAIAVDRFETATTCSVQRIHHRWAGLRCFAPDRSPVVGFDPVADGFFWLAGQGGYGIQTAPALARLAAALLRDREIPQDLQDEGLRPESVSPGRFAMGAGVKCT